MSPSSLRFYLNYWLAAAFALVGLAGCALETPPTLDEVRSGRVRGTVVEDTALQPGEIRGEVLEIDRARRELRVQTDVRGRRVLLYDRDGTRVMYHGWDYPVEQLESGDIIAFRTRPRREDEIETIRIEIPVQARRGPIASRGARPPKSDVVEGTVERIQLDRGVFDIQPRSGRTVTVSVPYNARPADIDSFRRLRTGDYVRVEGEFTNPDNLQLLSFLSPR
jgi:hypothetical protein